MWKHSKLFYCKWLFMKIIALCIALDDPASCKDCSNTILGTESKNITYGPSNEYNCNCDWIIPTSMDSDHETAVVLLLQNFSFPMTTGTGSTHCSGEIRFPSTDSHKCNFTSNYCFAFATASTICNISKIKEKIPVANHTCDSILPWNKAGGSPYKIQYYAKNLAGYTKYFTQQYLVVDCRSITTTFKPTTTNGWETTRKIPREISTTQKAEQTTKDKITEAEKQTTLSDSDRTETHFTIDLDKNITVTTRTNGSSASLMVAIPVSGIVGFIFGALSMFFIQRYCIHNNKKQKNKDSMKMRSIRNQQSTHQEKTTYENYTPTSDESGYEVPNQVDNKNEQSGYEVPIQVDNKNEQQYEVVKSGQEYQYENV